MADRVIVLSCVPVLGGVAAPHVAATETHAKMDPRITDRHAALAVVYFRGRYPYVIQMSTCHRWLNGSGRHKYLASLCGRLPSHAAEQVEHLAIECRNVVGFAARHEVAVHHNFLIHPLRACISQIRFEGRP